MIINSDYSSEILRGDIILCDLSPGFGSEYQGIRPCVVIQNNMGNKYSPTVTVVPVTSVMSKKKMPTHVYISEGRFGLARQSTITCEGLRTIDKKRFRNKLGSVDNVTMLQIENAIMINLGMIS